MATGWVNWGGVVGLRWLRWKYGYCVWHQRHQQSVSLYFVMEMILQQQTRVL